VNASTGVVTGVTAGTSVINYKTTTGGCVNTTSRTVTVAPNNTVSAASSTPTLCINTALTITHTTTGATGIGTATGLPSGVTAALHLTNYY
jgi:uncharacterized protein YjdB